MTPSSTQTNDSIVAPEGITEIHLPRDVESLRIETATSIRRLIPDQAVSVVVFGEDGFGTVEASLGGCPWALGSTVELSSWQPGESLPMTYRGLTVGELRYEKPLDEDSIASLRSFVDHLSIAVVNLQLNARALGSTEHYCASLQAFEEGVVLFQERDPEAVGARFLALLNSLLNTQIGALYVLDDINDPSSTLTLQHIQGMPDWMLDQLEAQDGAWWPSTVISTPTGIVERDQETGSFGDLRADSVAEPISNIVHCALQYHGVVVGVALVINADTNSIDLRLERARRLGELGAALFHRLCLEGDALKSREMETQLSIAANIQARLIPTKAPDSDTLTFAWQSCPADYVGGDYLDLLNDQDGNVHAIIADVSGHGIDSALLMASCRAAYRADCSRVDPHELLALLNNEVHNEVGDTGMFITAASLRFTDGGRTCTFASAGHNPLLLFRSATNSIEQLDSTGPSLGFFPGMDFDEATVTLEPDDFLFLYTDGIVEATDANDEMFGDDRLAEALISAATGDSEAIMDAVHTALAEFMGDRKCDDDVSSAVIKCVRCS